MHVRHQGPAQLNHDFREVFRNRAATGFSIGAVLGTLIWFLAGLILSVMLLLSVAFFALALLHVIFSLDPFDNKAAFADLPEGINGIVALLAGSLFFLILFGSMAYVALRRVRRRLFARLYVLSGRPLLSVEGSPTFDTGTEITFNGLEIGEFYFSFDDCWLDVNDEDLRKLEGAGGLMRVWYIPARTRASNSPTTGKVVKYNCILVQAEWRPVN